MVLSFATNPVKGYRGTVCLAMRVHNEIFISSGHTTKFIM